MALLANLRERVAALGQQGIGAALLGLRFADRGMDSLDLRFGFARLGGGRRRRALGLGPAGVQQARFDFARLFGS